MMCTQSPACRDLRVSPGRRVQTRKHTACDVGSDGGVRVPREQRRGCWDPAGSDWGSQHPLVHQFDAPLTAPPSAFLGPPGSEELPLLGQEASSSTASGPSAPRSKALGRSLGWGRSF